MPATDFTAYRFDPPEIEINFLTGNVPRPCVPLNPPAEAHPVRALIGGQTVIFKTAEEKFDALVKEWRNLRQPGSSTAPLVNDAYGQIVAMGQEAVPLLLREVERQSGHWFTALTWITGVNLATPATRGNIRELRKAWLQWGKDNGRIARDREGAMAAGQPPERAGVRL
jgi:hypothetical protein